MTGQCLCESPTSKASTRNETSFEWRESVSSEVFKAALRRNVRVFFLSTFANVYEQSFLNLKTNIVVCDL